MDAPAVELPGTNRMNGAAVDAESQESHVSLGSQQRPTAERIITALPPCPPARLTPRAIGFWTGLAGTWLAPRTFGPHLAAGPWRHAIAAQIIGMALQKLILDTEN